MSGIGFIGAGNMAGAIIHGIISAGLYKPGNVYVSDIDQDKLDDLAGRFGVSIADNNADVVDKAETVLLCVKPQHMDIVLEDIRESVMEGALLISVAAGTRADYIASMLDKDVAVVRVMPNTPALLGHGMSALYANEKALPVLEKAERIFQAVGETVIIEDEQLMNVVTAVSGSGPAYFFLLMEEMVNAATELGLEESLAKKLAIQTAKGAALLAEKGAQSGEDPQKLREKVTSPGGTTEAALKVLTENDFGALITAAISSATERGKQLSE